MQLKMSVNEIKNLVASSDTVSYTHLAPRGNAAWLKPSLQPRLAPTDCNQIVEVHINKRCV